MGNIEYLYGAKVYLAPFFVILYAWLDLFGGEVTILLDENKTQKCPIIKISAFL